MLGFRLNEEQESFRLAVRAFAEKELAPRVDELERTETFPMDLFRELGRLGYLGVGYPEEYGGSGGDMVMRCLLIEEIARVNCGFAAALLAHVGLGCIPIFKFGTEEQKKRYLVPAIRGEKLGSFGLSEPNSGSDAASIRTRAERRGDVYVINGSKMFITNGNIADYCLVAAYTDPSRRRSRRRSSTRRSASSSVSRSPSSRRSSSSSRAWRWRSRPRGRRCGAPPGSSTRATACARPRWRSSSRPRSPSA